MAQRGKGKDTRKDIRIRIDPEKKKELQKLLIDRDQTLQEFFEEYVDRVLKREQNKKKDG